MVAPMFLGVGTGLDPMVVEFATSGEFGDPALGTRLKPTVVCFASWK